MARRNNHRTRKKRVTKARASKPSQAEDGRASAPAKPYSPRTESGLTEIHEGRMVARAIERGWIKADRFPTTATKEEIENKVAGQGGPTLLERAVLTTHTLMDAEDNRSKGIAVRAVVAMERVNQADQLAPIPPRGNETPDGTVVTTAQRVEAMDESIPAGPGKESA